MTSRNQQVGQTPSSLRLIPLILVATGALAAVAMYIAQSRGIPIGHLTQDVAAVGDIPVFSGFISQIGLMLWVVAATVCLFTYAFLSQTTSGDRATSVFFLISGLFTALLGVDDAFMLHEAVFPYMGIPQNLVFFSYASFALFYLIRYRKRLLGPHYQLILFAFVCLSMSVVFDVVHPPWKLLILYEDASKLAGQLSWCAYFVVVCLEASSKRVEVWSSPTSVGAVSGLVS